MTVPSPEKVGASDAEADAARARGEQPPDGATDSDGVPVGPDDVEADRAASGADGTRDDG